MITFISMTLCLYCTNPLGTAVASLRILEFYRPLYVLVGGEKEIGEPHFDG